MNNHVWVVLIFTPLWEKMEVVSNVFEDELDARRFAAREGKGKEVLVLKHKINKKSGE